MRYRHASKKGAVYTYLHSSYCPQMLKAAVVGPGTVQQGGAEPPGGRGVCLDSHNGREVD